MSDSERTIVIREFGAQVILSLLAGLVAMGLTALVLPHDDTWQKGFGVVVAVVVFFVAGHLAKRQR